MDVQKWLGKTGIEFHWPGYQYMGPGTHLEKRLERGDKGINRLDRTAKQHDIDYSHAKNLQDKRKADTQMIKAVDRLPGKIHDGTRGQENHAGQKTFEMVKTPLMLFLLLLLLLLLVLLLQEIMKTRDGLKKKIVVGLFTTGH